jgi:hypothetical protein
MEAQPKRQRRGVHRIGLVLLFVSCFARSSFILHAQRSDRTPEPNYSNPDPDVDGAWHDNGPQVGRPWTNIFDLSEVRLTDGGNIGGGDEWGDGVRGPVTWWTNYFSAPGSFYDPSYNASINGYMVDVPLDNGLGNKLFIVDPSTMYTYKFCEPSWTNCNMPYAGEWSFTTPGLMYFGSGTKVGQYNYATETGPSYLFDFANCPGMPSGGGVGNLQVTRNGQIFAANIGSSVFAVWNVQNWTCAWLSSQTGMTGGTAHPTPVRTNLKQIGYNLHDGWLSATGSYTAIVDDSAPISAPFFWVPGSTAVTQCTEFAGCGGHIALGGSKAFYVISEPKTSGISVPAHYDFGVFPMNDPVGGNYTSGNYTRLHPVGPPYFNAYAPNTECNVTDTHPAWQNNTGSDSQPIIVSSFVDESSSYPLMDIVCAWDHEIDAVAPDGSGTTWRLAHNRATGESNPSAGYGSSYNALSMPVVSADGKLVMWVTDWMWNLGVQPGTDQYRTDVFIVRY